MANEVLSYWEVCQKEKTNLQRGMNFRLGGTYSVILMSVRANAPYKDRFEDDGTTLIYEGHDVPRYAGIINPKSLDQPDKLPSGKPTENGKFHQAAQEYKTGQRPAERIRVYEKLHAGIWSYNGVFGLTDSWQEYDGYRNVFKFKLVALKDDADESFAPDLAGERRRIIPTEVKLKVWKRDGGKCVICGATDELHFDHIIPYSKGGTSLSADNVQVLCVRHNLAKSDKII